MSEINLNHLMADVGLTSVIAAATPFYAIVLALGWSWRGWIRMVNLAMSFAVYARKPASIG